MSTHIFRIKPFQFIHILDNNENVTFLEVGPKTFVRKEHQIVTYGPKDMIIIPPRHYCVVSNPVERDSDGTPIINSNGSIKVRHGDEEIRFSGEPFPLYPGESVIGSITPLQILESNTALRLRAIRDFTEIDKDSNIIQHFSGEEWLFCGPGTYVPRVEVIIVELIRSTVIKPNTALKIRARRACKDSKGIERKAGEEWLVKTVGSYLPRVDEEVVCKVNGVILTQHKAIHVVALKTFVDIFSKERKAGQEWLVTFEDTECYIPGVSENVVGEVSLTCLNSSQYCVVRDPVNSSGKQLFGKREMRRGPSTFFLLPGESLERGIQNHYILGEEEALLLKARERFEIDSEPHEPGDLWMIYGPTEFVPPVEVDVVEKRKKIALDENEGIYVRDTKTGKIRSVIGVSYMLKPFEELWEKKMSPQVDAILSDKTFDLGSRDKTKVISFRAPQNTAIQIFDFKEKKSRVVFGPDLILLSPDEEFTLLSLSGDKPKRPHVLKTITLNLGPEYTSDIVTVETSDHARLSLQLSYNWNFEIDKSNENDAYRIFQVPDFIGDSCKTLASKIRGAVAAVPFDTFHKNSATIIRSSVFGVVDDKVGNKFVFETNKMVVTNIDIQSVEPVDQRTRDALQKSVQLAIEITTNSQEATARHEAERMEQEARGRLERQKIQDESKAEEARKTLLILQSESSAVESTGQAKAEAQAQAQASEIEGQSSVKQALLRAEALKITSEAELEQNISRQNNDIYYQKLLSSLEIQKKKQLSDIESNKFKSLVDSLGSETIKSISQAGPELQAKLLQGLGLKSFLITDGNSPINLFNTAKGMISSPI